MPKSAVRPVARERQGRLRRAELPNVIEGQIAELCRDLAVQTKRMHQLQEQADELRAVIGQWVSGSDADSRRTD
jgi:hypothetical protein